MRGLRLINVSMNHVCFGARYEMNNGRRKKNKMAAVASRESQGFIAGSAMQALQCMLCNAIRMMHSDHVGPGPKSLSSQCADWRDNARQCIVSIRLCVQLAKLRGRF